MSDHHPRRWRARAAATLVAATALAAAGASLAVADITLSDDKRGDARCDGPPCPDLKSAVGDHAPLDESTRFHIITQHNRIQAARTPRIAIDTRGGAAPGVPRRQEAGQDRRLRRRHGRAGRRRRAAQLERHRDVVELPAERDRQPEQLSLAGADRGAGRLAHRQRAQQRIRHAALGLIARGLRERRRAAGPGGVSAPRHARPRPRLPCARPRRASRRCCAGGSRRSSR